VSGRKDAVVGGEARLAVGEWARRKGRRRDRPGSVMFQGSGRMRPPVMSQGQVEADMPVRSVVFQGHAVARSASDSA
jgi:hypothetical protein